MPVAAVAGQARRLDAEYGADGATAYGRDELLKTRPLHESGPGAPQIVIDRDDRCEAHFASMGQVTEHTESKRRQYSLAESARDCRMYTAATSLLPRSPGKRSRCPLIPSSLDPG